MLIIFDSATLNFVVTHAGRSVAYTEVRYGEDIEATALETLREVIDHRKANDIKEDDNDDEEDNKYMEIELEDIAEEGQGGGLLHLESPVVSPPEGGLLQARKAIVGRFFHHPMTIEEALRCKGTEALLSLLKNCFDVVAQGKYAWIRELDDIGYTRDEIADLLAEQAGDAPWIFFKPNTFDKVPVSTNIHLSGCAHQYLLSKEWPPDQRSRPLLHNLPIGNWQDIMESIQELCGLGGIAPTTRDLETWNGSVEFKEQNSVALVTYSRLSDKSNLEHYAITSRIINVLERFCLAAGLAQDARLCCDSFTLLRMATRNTEQLDQTEPLIELCRIDFKWALQLLMELKILLVSYNTHAVNVPKIQNIVLQLFLPSIQEATENTNDSDVEKILHYCSLAVQLVCLGFLSYSQAHVGPIRPFFLDTSLKTVQILGIQTSRDGYHHLEGTLKNLTCINGLIQGSVLTFDLLSSLVPARPSSVLPTYDLLANPVDFLDTWGPGYFLAHEGLNRPLCAIKVGGGFVFATNSTSTRFHWSREVSLQNLRQGNLDPSTKKLIGTSVTVNRSCKIDEDQCWENSTTSLEPLGPYARHWDFDEKQFGLQAGNYVNFQAIAASHKLPALTLKQHRLQQDDETLISFLDNLWGVQVSFCTRIARRVPLRELVADLLPVFTIATISSQDETRFWEELEMTHDINGAFQHEEIREWLITLPPQLHHQVLKLIRKIFNVLQHTGLDREGKNLLIAWPHERDLFRCFKVPCEKESSWAGILADSEDCATFAYISKKCFEPTRIKCSGSDPTWQDVIPLLQTAVVLHAAGPNTITCALQHNETYFFKKVDNLFFAKVIRRDIAGTANLITFRSISPPEIQRRLLVKFREVQKRRVRLREKIACRDQAEQVAVSQLTLS